MSIADIPKFEFIKAKLIKQRVAGVAFKPNRLPAPINCGYVVFEGLNVTLSVDLDAIEGKISRATIIYRCFRCYCFHLPISTKNESKVVVVEYQAFLKLISRCKRLKILLKIQFWTDFEQKNRPTYRNQTWHKAGMCIL